MILRCASAYVSEEQLTESVVPTEQVWIAVTVRAQEPGPEAMSHVLASSAKETQHTFIDYGKSP